jgi:flagellar FliL protein
MAAPAKPEAKPASPAPDKEKPAAEGAAPAAAAAKGSALKAWLPALVILVLAPAGSFALAEFVLLPRLQAKLAAPAATESAHGADETAAEPAAAGEKKGHGEKEGAAAGNYEFANVVVNLAGTMGTRYLKTSFVVTGVKNVSTKGLFESDKAKLTDITLNVLSSLSLADLEEPGSKNVLREKLVAAYNQALGKRVVEQVYFSDFVIQ